MVMCKWEVTSELHFLMSRGAKFFAKFLLLLFRTQISVLSTPYIGKKILLLICFKPFKGYNFFM